MADGYFIQPAEAPQVEMLPKVHRRTMGVTDEVMLCEFFLEREAQIPEHNHLNDQVGYIIYGQIELTIAGVTKILFAGDSYAVPGGVLHSLKAVIDSLVIDCFSPPREDYRTEAR